MEQSVTEGIRKYIVTTWLDGDARSFDDETDLHQSGILDSFSTLALIAFLEETWNARIDPSDVSAESFRTVKNVAQLVLAKSTREVSAAAAE
jgi:acyl carrier protein